jgi:hypothetical protein
MVAAAQPDFGTLGNHLTGVAQEIGRIPNMPALIGLGELMAQLAAQHREDLAAREEQPCCMRSSALRGPCRTRLSAPGAD